MTERPHQERSLFRLLEAQATLRPNHVATRTRRAGGWEWTTWADWYGAASAVAVSLIARGIQRGDAIGLFASTSEEWTVADFGILGAGAVTVPIYPTSTAEQLAYVLENSGVRLLFIEGEAQLAVALAAVPGTKVTELVVLNPRLEGASAPSPVTVTTYTEFVRAGRHGLERADGAALLRERTASVREEDLATILYTSGTTGAPRGAMVTHGALLAEMTALKDAFRIEPYDEQLLVLPLSHILARTLVLVQVASGSRLAFGEGAQRLLENLAEVEPTFFAAVPRLFEKVYAVANQSARAEGPLKAALWSWATGVGREASRARQVKAKPGRLLAARSRYADQLVLGRVRRSFGRRLRFAISGGAPLSAELAEWFHGVGVIVLEGYGLTEVCGASHVNREDAYRFGTVGRPLAGVEAKTAADGEVLLRGPTLMKGYLGAPEATARAIDAEGWFHTGDIGRIAPDGFLTIIDRKKDVIVTAGGSNVAPQNIEGMLKASPFVGHAVVFGDREPYLVALLALDPVACQRWAREHGRRDDLTSLATDPELFALLKLEVDSVNRRLASYETIKRFAVLPRPLSVEEGELTETHKVRRGVVRSHFGDLIESLYDRKPS